MKATVSQTVMFYFPFGFCGLGKSIQISQCIYSISQFLRIYKNLLISINDCGGVQQMKKENCDYANNILLHVIKAFPRSDDIRIFVESPVDKAVITKQSDSITIVVTVCLIVQYWLIFSSFLVFYQFLIIMQNMRNSENVSPIALCTVR